MTCAMNGSTPRSSARRSPTRKGLSSICCCRRRWCSPCRARMSSPGVQARNKALPLKALADETFIVYRRHNGPGLYDAILSACNAAGFSPRVGQEAPRIVSTLNLVAAGLGISLVPGIVATHADGRRRVPPLGRRRTAEGSAISCVATWRELGGGPELSGTGQAARAQRLRVPCEPLEIVENGRNQLLSPGILLRSGYWQKD